MTVIPVPLAIDEVATEVRPVVVVKYATWPTVPVPVTEPLPTHTLLIAKHPDVVMFNPPANVLVAVVVASNTAAVVVPTTESLEYGEVVPIPT